MAFGLFDVFHAAVEAKAPARPLGPAGDPRQRLSSEEDVEEAIREPHLIERKRMGFSVMIFLAVFAALMYLSKKRVWAGTAH